MRIAHRGSVRRQPTLTLLPAIRQHCGSGLLNIQTGSPPSFLINRRLRDVVVAGVELTPQRAIRYRADLGLAEFDGPTDVAFQVQGSGSVLRPDTALILDYVPKSQTPPAERWLDELGRLKDGRSMGL